MKRVLKGVVLLAVGVLLAIAGVMVPVFAGLKPMADGQELPGGARRVNDGYTSSYLLPLGNGEVALVDCGNDVEAKTLKDALAKQGLGFAAVKAIFVTHAHPDHTGGCKQFPNAKVYVGEGDKGLAEATEAGKGLIPSMAGPQKHLALTGLETVKEGDVVQVGPLSVRVFIIPGHTAGSAAYLVNGALYVGDSLAIEADGDKVRAAPWPFSDDTTLNVAELKRLGKLLAPQAADVKAIVPAHSGEAVGLKPLLEFAGS